MMFVLKKANNICAGFFILLVKIYKALRPAHVSCSCRFLPTCSTYAIDALKTHNVFYALYLITRRIIRCNPFVKGSVDPVPEKKCNL